tara:strand:+ start:348 stop:605 length:258 start_codon:yes stop_codon:yes gene_type:complete
MPYKNIGQKCPKNKGADMGIKKDKFSNEFKKVKFDEYGLVKDKKYEELTLIIEEAIMDDDTPEWKRKLAFAVDKELYPEDYKEEE